MASILNPDFEDWNHGTLIADPTDGQELADDWFWHKGSVPPTVQVRRENSIVYSGAHSFSIEPGTSGFGSNLNTYAYQDIAAYTDLLGLTVVVTCAVYSPSDVTGVTAHIFVDDGVTVTDSLSNVKDDSWHILTVTKTISPSATRVRIGLMTDMYGIVIAYFDEVTLSVAHVLDLSDSVTPADSLTNQETKVIAESIAPVAVVAKMLIRPIASSTTVSDDSSRTAVKAFQDVQVIAESVNISQILGPMAEVLVGEWVHVEVVPANRWTNSNE